VTAAQRNKLKSALLALLRELDGKGTRKIEPNRTSEAESGGDEDEQPLNEMMQAIASNRNKSDTQVRAQVEKALLKIAKEPESYGECEECDEELPLGRLQAMPYAELCVNCQAKRDGPKGRATRKKLTEFI
jgi:DnaK suppressor protein